MDRDELLSQLESLNARLDELTERARRMGEENRSLRQQQEQLGVLPGYVVLLGPEPEGQVLRGDLVAAGIVATSATTRTCHAHSLCLCVHANSSSRDVKVG